MPATLTPTVVLFDLYNTLIRIKTNEHDPRDWERLARVLRYRGLPAEAQPLHDSYFAAMTAQRQQRGGPHPEIDGHTLFCQLLEKLGYRGNDLRSGSAPPVPVIPRALHPRLCALRRCAAGAARAARALPLGLLSDAQRAFLPPEVEEVGLSGFFDEVFITSDFGFRKPDPRLFQTALATFGVPAREACFIGDNPTRDALGAMRAGLTGVWLRREGGHYRAPHTPPDHTVPNLYAFQALLGV